MNEIIKITEVDGKQAVSARSLYEFLEVTERFSTWFERQLQFGFIENQDFTSVKSFTLVVTTTTKVTGKGQIYFVNKFLNNR